MPRNEKRRLRAPSRQATKRQHKRHAHRPQQQGVLTSQRGIVPRTSLLGILFPFRRHAEP